MKRKHWSKKTTSPNFQPPQPISELCGQLHSDDGIDPAEFFRPQRRNNADHRKAHQLCHQVANTLSLVIGSEFGEALSNLRVVAVTPAPDSSQLLVLVAPAVVDEHVHPDEVLNQLNRVAGRLRAEVATAITRRRAPKLIFQVIAADLGREQQP